MFISRSPAAIFRRCRVFPAQENKQILGVPLPLNLDFMGMKGCLLHNSFDATWLFTVQNGVGQFSVTIPNNQAFVGVNVYFQSAAESVTSNGGEVLIGNR